jgi:hypothetical protein
VYLPIEHDCRRWRDAVGEHGIRYFGFNAHSGAPNKAIIALVGVE